MIGEVSVSPRHSDLQTQSKHGNGAIEIAIERVLEGTSWRKVQRSPLKTEQAGQEQGIDRVELE